MKSVANWLGTTCLQGVCFSRANLFSIYWERGLLLEIIFLFFRQKKKKKKKSVNPQAPQGSKLCLSQADTELEMLHAQDL